MKEQIALKKKLRQAKREYDICNKKTQDFLIEEAFSGSGLDLFLILGVFYARCFYKKSVSGQIQHLSGTIFIRGQILSHVY